MAEKAVGGVELLIANMKKEMLSYTNAVLTIKVQQGDFRLGNKGALGNRDTPSEHTYLCQMWRYGLDNWA